MSRFIGRKATDIINLGRRRILVATVGLLAWALLTLGAGPAGAIVGGAPDGTAHPYAGAVDATPLGGRNPVASGVLISPTVFLTAAHFTRVLDSAGLTRARVTFDPVVSHAATWYTGTVHTNPAYDPSISGVSGDPGDLGVIVFDTPVPGITPASLPTEGLLDQLAPKELSSTGFTGIGYGISERIGANGRDFTSAGTRRIAQETFASLGSGWLRLRTIEGADICNGDSGGPSLLGASNLVAGITSIEWSLSGGECRSMPWYQRLDTPSARAFLGQYVTLP